MNLYLSCLILFGVINSGLAGRRPSPRQTICQTPDNLPELFINSCLDLGITSSVCNEGWNAFMSAFAGKDPDDMKLEDYNDYFNVFPLMPGKNATLFWSGTFPTAEEIANDPRFNGIYSSVNLIASAIINNLEYGTCWCGDPINGGILYGTPCPSDNAVTVFWADFSVILGHNSEGIVFWLANGERSGGTYQPTNFFGLYEFPNLRPGVANRLVVIDIHREGIGEACGEGSLITLRSKSVAKFSSNGYGCYEVGGDAWDPPSISLTDILDVITEEWKGT